MFIIPERCKVRFTPASTYKILHSFIGLDTKVLKDKNHVIPWDGKKGFLKVWEKDHTLETAIKYSVVPYYKELARRVDREKAQYYLNEFNYGNKTIGENIDNYWLDNSLKISAEEQMDFLIKFCSFAYPKHLTHKNIQIVKDIMVLEETDEYTFAGKTGLGYKEDETYIGWFVGFVTTQIENPNTYYFVLNMDGKNFQEVAKKRKEFS